jgi:CBS domain-containing protein
MAASRSTRSRLWSGGPFCGHMPVVRRAASTITSGATPLKALDAIAFDTETTGLDPAKDRIVQIGAVAIGRGVVDEGASLERLVNPHVPIPASATAVHSITDAMVSGAPSFAGAWREFAGFAAGRILIGHSIGFDLAIMAKEASRAGLGWEKPRSLCVRLLATAANPLLPDHSLETLAGWLGVAIGDRHTALADARAAADIFVALLPHLAARGVNTLAEAERACLGLTEQLASHHRSGWVAPVSRPEAFRSFVAVDPYAYRHRLSELMSRPPVVVRNRASVREAMALMLSRRISSVFVSEDGEPGAAQREYGIVTERDVMRHLSSGGEAAFTVPVGEIASRPLASVRAAAFAYRAIGRMARLGIRHLAVCDDAGRLVGAVSSRDLLKLRGSGAIHLNDAIEAASSVNELAAAWATLPSVVQSLIAEEVDAHIIAEIASEELRAMTRRAATLAEAAMAAEGKGEPPCAYALLVLGSGGRGESLLAADQDNAIVFAGGEPGGAEDAWFAELGERIAVTLDGSGIAFCKGGVMARNAPWRGSLESWNQRVSHWVGRSRPEDLLNVDIFFDLQAVHGDNALAAELYEHAFASARGQVAFAKVLGETAATPVDPFTLLGNFRTERGRIDLKRHGLFPIVAFARALSIRHEIVARSTRDRLAGLSEVGPAAELRRLAAAHACVLKYMLGQQCRDVLAGLPASNRVEVASLSRDEQAELRTALKNVQSVPDLLRAMMFD